MQQGKFSASGAVLSRFRVGDGALRLTLFLKNHGLICVSVPGAEGARVRFGGGTEPFVWGSFQLHRGKSGGCYLESVDAADDMLALRRRPDAVFMAVRWSKLIMKFLMREHPDNELLANLYWNMLLLCDKNVPADAAEWRFIYRWLSLWGLAPELNCCGFCGGMPDTLYWTADGLVCSDCSDRAAHESPQFTAGELRFLNQFARGDTKFISSAFAADAGLLGMTGLFRLACRCCEMLLYQK